MFRFSDITFVKHNQTFLIKNTNPSPSILKTEILTAGKYLSKNIKWTQTFHLGQHVSSRVSSHLFPVKSSCKPVSWVNFKFTRGHASDLFLFILKDEKIFSLWVIPYRFIEVLPVCGKDFLDKNVCETLFKIQSLDSK